MSFTDPDGGWDGDSGMLNDPFGRGFYANSTNANNPDAYGGSEFDRKYSNNGPRGGSIGADGNYTSDETWIGAAHDTWVSKFGERQSNGQDVAYIPVNPDGSGNLDGEVIAIGRNESADRQYTHIKNRGQAKDKGFWSDVDDAIGEGLFGKRGYSAVKKYGGDNNPYVYSYDEMQEQATEVFWATTYLVPVGEVVQWMRMMVSGTKLAEVMARGTNVVYHGFDAAGNVRYVGITGKIC